MNKGQFLKELKVRLKYLPATDREDAIRFYDEYISEMELSDDEDVTAKLGTPKEVASDIISQCTQKQIDDTKEQRTVKGSAKTAWLVILGILSLPIVILIATFLFVLIVLILAAVVVIFAGALAIPWALFVPGFAQKMFTLGYGLISLGIGVLITYALTALLRKIIRSITSKRRARVYANE